MFVDPAYGASIIDVLENTSGLNGVGFLNYFRTMRSGNATTTIWGYHDQIGCRSWAALVFKITDQKYI